MASRPRWNLFVIRRRPHDAGNNTCRFHNAVSAGIEHSVEASLFFLLSFPFSHCMLSHVFGCGEGCSGLGFPIL
jgi:hypothetical protein